MPPASQARRNEGLEPASVFEADADPGGHTSPFRSGEPRPDSLRLGEIILVRSLETPALGLPIL